MNIIKKSYWDILPIEIQNLIIEYSKKKEAAMKIQNTAYKMFYNKYGISWKENIQNYQDYLDYYCYRYGINDSIEDYYNYYYDKE